MPTAFTRARSTNSFRTVFQDKVRLFVSFNKIAIFLATSHTSFSFRRNIHLLQLIRRFLNSIRVFLRQRNKTVPRVQLRYELLTSYRLVNLVHRREARPLVRVLLNTIVNIRDSNSIQMFHDRFVYRDHRHRQTNGTVVSPPTKSMNHTSRKGLSSTIKLNIYRTLRHDVRYL